MACSFGKTYSTILVFSLTVAFCTRLVAANNQTVNFTSPMPRDHQLETQFNSEASNESTTETMTTPEMQSLIYEEDEDQRPMDCCPTMEEMVEPQGGRDQREMYVELYRDGEYVQRFFEYSCRPDVLDKPCRFIDRELQAQSRCVQKYSYTYAIVRTTKGEQHRWHRRRSGQSQPQQPFPALPGNIGTSSWTLDYIRVRSGCGCEVSPKPRKS